MTTVNLFTTPIRVLDGLVDSSKIDMLRDAVVRYKQSIISDRRFLHSQSVSRPIMTNLIIRDVRDHVSELNIITDSIAGSVRDYAISLTGDSDIDIELSHSWLAYQSSGFYVQRHNHTFVTEPRARTELSITHTIVHINAIFYIAATSQDKLDLYYPNQNMVLTSGTRSLSGLVAGAIPCKANRLVLIPSWLDHSVDARPRDRDKICLSANYVIRKQN